MKNKKWPSSFIPFLLWSLTNTSFCVFFLCTAFSVVPPAESHKRIYFGLFCHYFLLSLTPLVWLPRNSHFTVFWIFLPFASSGWFVIILAYFFFFTVWGKEIAPLSEKTFFFPFSVLFPVHTFWDFQNSWTFIIIFYPHCFDFIFQMK